MEIYWPESISVQFHYRTELKAFIQSIANRAAQGSLRYPGPASKKKKYLTRLKIELREYERTGNFEQLLNLAVYCFLESLAPENPKFHFDNTVDSVTRNIMEEHRFPKDGGPA